MTTSLSGTLRGNVSLTLRQTTGTLVDITQDPLTITGSISLTNGEGANQAEDLFHKTDELASGASVNFDLSGTAIANAFGTDLAWKALKGIYVENGGSSDSTLMLKGDLAEAFGAAAAGIKIPAGGFILLPLPDAAGIAITGGSADTITLTHAADGSIAITYTIALWGTN